jgi:hypothetical protein
VRAGRVVAALRPRVDGRVRAALVAWGVPAVVAAVLATLLTGLGAAETITPPDEAERLARYADTRVPIRQELQRRHPGEEVPAAVAVLVPVDDLPERRQVCYAEYGIVYDPGTGRLIGPETGAAAEIAEYACLQLIVPPSVLARIDGGLRFQRQWSWEVNVARPCLTRFGYRMLPAPSFLESLQGTTQLVAPSVPNEVYRQSAGLDPAVPEAALAACPPRPPDVDDGTRRDATGADAPYAGDRVLAAP